MILLSVLVGVLLIIVVMMVLLFFACVDKYIDIEELYKKFSKDSDEYRHNLQNHDYDIARLELSCKDLREDLNNVSQIRKFSE